MKRLSITLAALFLASGANAQAAGNFTLESGVSTLGIFAAPSAEISPSLRVRAPLYMGSLSDSFDMDGNDVDGEISVNSLGLMADYHPWQGGFRVSGGVHFGGYSLSGEVTDPEFDGDTYSGDFEITVEQQRSVAPALALGYAHSFGDTWGVAVELGARLTALEISSKGQESLAAADREDYEAEIADINDDLEDFGVLPYISLGVNFNF
ncbi:autotransporter domain-containing protein [Poseidonocella sedimentorum]|uniref:Autotransporter beta-domain-containing protein n=1 Tax=Poseidonocella sedimentorum TaxID=871652 RepID=A0A1I6D374_9RHOB|nr:autotransporter domain-containing protein [Poseidonocella sedimentorum]SFQ99880.1 Autotransporter beta-domain-containing protein [Poseidonocella sedimentorum]